MFKFLKSTYLSVVLLLIYIPLSVLIIFSFNSGESLTIFQGFSFKWYEELAKESSFIQSIVVSILVAVISTIISTIIGLFAALGLSKSRRITQKMTLSVSNIPIINADIITAVSLMLLFMAFGINFGLTSLVFAHISFSIPYVIITIMPRMKKIDAKLIEASIDLGASSAQTLRKIILPILKPAIASGAAIAFAMSFDDFIISYFTGGDEVNVSTFIYTMKRLKPFVNAFGTICIAIVGLFIFGFNIYNFTKSAKKSFEKKVLKNKYQDKQNIKIEKELWSLYYQANFSNELVENDKQELWNKIDYLEEKLKSNIDWVKQKKSKYLDRLLQKEEQRKVIRKKFYWLSRSWRSILLLLVIASSSSALVAFYIINNSYDIVFANWGSFMDPDIIKEFEEKHDVKIRYTVYDSNETLYNKLYTTNYDVMVPSDYMANKLAQEEVIEEIDYVKLNQVDNDFLILKPNKDFDGKIFNNDGSPKYTEGNENFNNLNIDNDFIDYLKSINHDFIEDHYQSDKEVSTKAVDANSIALVNNSLQAIQNANNWKSNTESIASYSLPLFWGEMSIVINPTPSNINLINDYLNDKNSHLPSSITDQFGIEHKDWIEGRGQYIFNEVVTGENEISSGLSWDILEYAAKRDKKVLLNDDPKNLFLISSQILSGKAQPRDEGEAQKSFNYLNELFKSPNISLMNDEIINAASDGNFDFAFMYNGDAIYADSLFAETKKPESINKLIIENPANRRYVEGVDQNIFEGTNIYSDNLVINKNSRNRDLSYKLINFLTQKSSDLSAYVGYTSPYDQNIKTMLGYEGADETNEYFKYYSDYQSEYVPVGRYNKTTSEYNSFLQSGDEPFIFNEELDKFVVNLYNILISRLT